MIRFHRHTTLLNDNNRLRFLLDTFGLFSEKTPTVHVIDDDDNYVLPKRLHSIEDKV